MSGVRVAPVTQHGITYFGFRWNYVLCDWGGSVILVSSFDVGRLIHNKGWLLALRLFFLASNASLIMEKSKCRRLLFVWFGRTLDETDNSTTVFLFHRFDESWPYQWFWSSVGVDLELSSESLDITTFSSSSFGFITSMGLEVAIPVAPHLLCFEVVGPVGSLSRGKSNNHSLDIGLSDVSPQQGSLPRVECPVASPRYILSSFMFWLRQGPTLMTFRGLLLSSWRRWEGKSATLPSQSRMPLLVCGLSCFAGLNGFDFIFLRRFIIDQCS